MYGSLHTVGLCPITINIFLALVTATFSLLCYDKNPTFPKGLALTRDIIMQSFYLPCIPSIVETYS